MSSSGAIGRAVLALVLVALLPTVGAVPVSVATTSFTVGSVPSPVSEGYEFSFTDPPFDGSIGGNDSIRRGVVEMALDWGHLSKSSHVRRADMTFNFSSVNGSVEVRIVVSSVRHWGGSYTLSTEAFRPGEAEPFWTANVGALHPWAGIDYRSSSILAYGENDTNILKPDRAPHHDYWKRDVGTHQGGAVYLVDPDRGAAAFSTRDVRLFHVADLDGLTGVSVTVDYLEGLPDLLEIKSRFMTADALGVFDAGDDCTGFKKWVNQALGFCPTLEGVVGAIAGTVQGVLKIILAPVPGGAQIAVLAGQISGEIVALYLSVLSLIVVAPARMVVVVGGHVVAFSLLGAAHSGNLRDVPAGIKAGFSGIGRFFALYFVGWFWAIKWVYQLVASVVHSVVQAIRG